MDMNNNDDSSSSKPSALIRNSRYQEALTKLAPENTIPRRYEYEWQLVKDLGIALAIIDKAYGGEVPLWPRKTVVYGNPTTGEATEYVDLESPLSLGRSTREDATNKGRFFVASYEPVTDAFDKPVYDEWGRMKTNMRQFEFFDETAFVRFRRLSDISPKLHALMVNGWKTLGPINEKGTCDFFLKVIDIAKKKAG